MPDFRGFLDLPPGQWFTVPHCKHCGNHHDGQCWRVKAVEYHTDGSVKRVEYFDPQAVYTFGLGCNSKPVGN